MHPVEWSYKNDAPKERTLPFHQLKNKQEIHMRKSCQCALVAVNEEKNHTHILFVLLIQQGRHRICRYCWFQIQSKLCKVISILYLSLNIPIQFITWFFSPIYRLMQPKPVFERRCMHLSRQYTVYMFLQWVLLWD